jgi:L-2,4-diaminobutyric acid acetyltransferase
MNTLNAKQAEPVESNITFQIPNAQLAWQVHQLIQQCPPLDTNSVYCNLLQCDHFADTCVAAMQNNKLVGFISAYIKPQQPDTLFVWQVAVHELGRGKGLASKMLVDILQRKHCHSVQFLETTITKNNQASWALFNRLTEKLHTSNRVGEYYKKDEHFNGQHDTEHLLRIGPFQLSGA